MRVGRKKLEKKEEGPKEKTDNEIKLARLLTAREVLLKYDIHRQGQLDNVIGQLQRELL